MRKVFIVVAAAASLPLLALGQSLRTGGFTSSGPAQTPPAQSRIATIENCTVSPLSNDGEALVPAQEAGVIIGFTVKELANVNENDLLAKIDDAMAQKQFANAEAEYNAAQKKADSDADIRAAKKLERAAFFEWQKNLEANKGSQGAVSAVEVMHSQYQHEHAELAIEQNENEKVINGFTAKAKAAEMESARESIKGREVRAPFPGVVQKFFPHKGEWVKPGDPVVKLIRMDCLKVEGYLKVADFNPDDLMDRPVTVKVMLAEGREVSRAGKIVYVDPEVKSLREFMVRAEVENRPESGKWPLRPGLPAKMEIQLQ
jgi:multidrug resistance efflux pump